MEIARSVVKKIDRVLYKFIEIISALFLTGVIVLVIGQVILRYVFNSGFSWITEVGQILLCAVAFTSMAIGVRDNLHISLLVLYDRLPKPAREVINKIVILCTLAFGIGMAYYGYTLMLSQWKFTIPSTGWPLGCQYITCTFAGAVVAYQSIISLIGLDKGIDDDKITDEDAKIGDGGALELDKDGEQNGDV